MIDACRFDEFFASLYGYPPFPWQSRLARQVALGDWPRLLDLPTASGKTSVLDVFVFALSCQADRAPADRTAPLRMAYVVDRRVIVDEAFERAKKLVKALQNARDGILHEVANALLDVAGSDVPLQCVQLRGGMYRDDSWARTPTQPTILTCTVDQIGSRLLFRSYGAVGSRMYSIHAGLAAYDMLIVLDEAHCAKPFEQTADAVSRYRQWGAVTLPAPFHFVTMTATPQSEEPPFALSDEDRANAVLGARLNARKPALLIETKDDVATVLAAQALALAQKGLRAIGVMVNRVKTARDVYTELRAQHGDRVLLMIGRMRPFDRDRVQGGALFQQLLADKSTSRMLDHPVFIVATQTLEVGANLDFDGLVTECASLDALRQRFGRLNRIGRDVHAEGVIVIRADQAKDSSDDPVYGAALAHTWRWLAAQAKSTKTAGKTRNGKKPTMPASVDFGIAALGPALKALSQTEHRGASLMKSAEDAPIMLPAHIDAWAQTAPTPAPEPDVSIFLHGPQRGAPQVKLVWRADIDADDTDEQMILAVATCPPTSVEALEAPLYLVREWLSGRTAHGEDLNDIEGEPPPNAADVNTVVRRVVLWRGPDDSVLPRRTRDVWPGDTVVIPVDAGGWETFGHVLDDAVDIAEPALWQARREAVVRLHTRSLEPLADGEVKRQLLEWARATDEDDPPDREELRRALGRLSECAPAHMQAWARAFAKQKSLSIEPHPSQGWVVRASIPHEHQEANVILPAVTEEDDSASLLAITGSGTVSLRQHSEGVARFAAHFAKKCGLPGAMVSDFELAGELHDLGKSDPRFQRWLYGCAGQRYTPDKPLIAKSTPGSEALRRRAQAESHYPKGTRHEVMSVGLVQQDEHLRTLASDWDLVLHLIASHHGHCRPCAPAVGDSDQVTVQVSVNGRNLTASSRHELQRLDSGIADRFWLLTRTYGWWGLAYLESIFRLADHQQSARDNGRSANDGRTE